jgi:hypothetical protein
MLHLVEYCHLAEARLLNISGLPGASCLADQPQVAGNGGAVHADLFGGLLWVNPAMYNCQHPSPSFGQHLDIPSFFGQGRSPVWVAAESAAIKPPLLSSQRKPKL